MICQIVKNDIEKLCADEDDPDVSKGLFSLPFMKRAAEKQKKASAKQAQELLAELDGMEPENLVSGRRNFGLEGGTQVSFPWHLLNKLNSLWELKFVFLMAHSCRGIYFLWER